MDGRADIGNDGGKEHKNMISPHFYCWRREDFREIFAGELQRNQEIALVGPHDTYGTVLIDTIGAMDGNYVAV